MKIFIFVILAIIFLELLWRSLSRKKSLPCPVWLKWLLEIDNPFTKVSKASVIIDNLDLQMGMKVLDAGCGPGRVTIPLAKKVGKEGRVFALDVQRGMLSCVKEKAKKSGLTNIEYLHGKIEEAGLSQNKFDRAILVTVLGEISDREKGLKEIFYGLKRGGILSVTEIIFDPHFQRKNKTVELSAKAGFKLKKIIGKPWAYTMLLEKP